jgi:hypothetical protein
MKHLFSKATLPGWALLLLSQLKWLYAFVDAWSNVEFISDKIRSIQPLALLIRLFASAWFQVALIVAGLGWIALATSGWPPHLSRFRGSRHRENCYRADKLTEKLTTRIPGDVVTSVKAAFDGYYQARSEQLDRQIRIAENQLALDGLGNSTAVADRFRELYRDVLRDCLSRLLTSFEQAFEAYGGQSKSIAQPIVDMIDGFLQPISSDFNQRLDQAASNAGVPLHKNLDDEVARLHTEAKVEVDLLLARLQLRASAGQKRWYEGPGGIIVLGILVTVVGGLLLALLAG